MDDILQPYGSSYRAMLSEVKTIACFIAFARCSSFCCLLPVAGHLDADCVADDCQLLVVPVVANGIDYRHAFAQHRLAELADHLHSNVSEDRVVEIRGKLMSSAISTAKSMHFDP